jgi:hypothetical protein
MGVLATCHVHSVWSYDGTWSIEHLATAFNERGSRVLMMTEHDRGFTEARFEEYRDACAEASSGSLYVLPGTRRSRGIVASPFWRTQAGERHGDVSRRNGPGTFSALKRGIVSTTGGPQVRMLRRFSNGPAVFRSSDWIITREIRCFR